MNKSVKLVAFFLVFCMSFPLISASATSDSVISGGICGDSMEWEYAVESGVPTLVISGSGEMSFDGEAPWAEYADELQKLKITGTVTSVADSAFMNFTALETVALPDCLTYIGDYAFSGCINLREINVPSALEYIGNYALEHCESFEHFVFASYPIGESPLWYIGDYAFAYCYALNEFHVPETVTYLGAYCFIDCSKIEYFTFVHGTPYGLEEIYEGTFYGCYALYELLLPNSLQRIDRSLDWCMALRTLGIPPMVESIEIYDCPLLETVAGREDTYAERIAPSLDAVFVPYEIYYQDVGGNSGSSGGESTAPPPGTEETTPPPNTEETAPPGDDSGNVGDDTELGYPVSGQCGYDMYWSYDYATSTLTLSGSGDMFDFWLDTPWACCYIENIVFEGNITSIGNNAFRDCGLSELKLPDTLERIGEYAFAGTRGYSEVTIPASMRLLCEGAFTECGDLQTVNMEEGLEYVGEDAFSNCYSLTDAVFPFTLRQLENCLEGCESLESFGIPPHVYFNEIDRYSHPSLRDVYAKIDSEESNSAMEIAQDCGATLHDYDLYHGVMDTDIPWYMPEDRNTYPNVDFTDWRYDSATKTLTVDCDGAMPEFGSMMRPWDGTFEIENLVITDSVTHIGDYAFAYMSELKNVTVGSGVQDIGYSAFHATDLQEVTMVENEFYSSPNGTYVFDKSAGAVVVGTNRASMSSDVGIEKIAYGAFSARSMTGIKLPEGVYEICDDAFGACNELRSVTFPSTLSVIGDDAFASCTSLASLGLKNVNSIGDYAFYGCTSLTRVVLPDSVSKVGFHAFKDSDNITHVTIGSGLTEITNSAFNEMHGLTSIVIPSTVEIMTEGEFSSCPLEVIYGAPDTTAEGLARLWGVAFVSIANHSNGDIDGTGTIDALDYVSVKRAVLGTMQINNGVYDFADINKDGVVDAIDYTLLKRAVLGTYTIQ